MPGGTNTPASFSTVDERTKAQAMRTATPTNVTSTRSGITAQAGTRLAETLAAQNVARIARDAAFANKPTEDPGPGNRWVWQERNQTWARVVFGDGGGFAAGGGVTGGGNTGGGNTGGSGNVTGQPTNNIDVIKAALRGLGFTSAILDSSTAFLNNLLKEGLDQDNVLEVFLNSKDYTLKSGVKIDSPFYAEYGFLNEGLVVPKSASELFNAVEGYKEVIDKYSLSKKFLEKDALKQYTKNNVTAKDLAERANVATLKSVNQDPAYVEALQRLGFIATAADLKDFFMDPKIGQEQLNINRTTGAFAAEAVRRARSGIQFNSERFKSLAQTMVEKGISESGAATLAAQGFENIAAQLGTTTKLSGIYETQRAATSGQIQQELETEEFGGLESERRKRLREQELRAFQGSAGTTSSSLRGSNVLGII
jgi:hypothetical protein